MAYCSCRIQHMDELKLLLRQTVITLIDDLACLKIVAYF